MLGNLANELVAGDACDTIRNQPRERGDLTTYIQ